MARYIFGIEGQQGSPEIGSLREIARRTTDSLVGWRTLLSLPHFYAAYAQEQSDKRPPILLHHDRGVIFGTLYDKRVIGGENRYRPIYRLSRDQSDTIIHSNGRSLVSDYWGHYVAIIRYPDTVGHTVFRSPVSSLPCFRVRIGTVTLFFSHLVDYLPLALRPVTINWDCITAQVVAGDYLTDETAVNEITSLECGESIVCRHDDFTTETYWDPRTFLRKRTLDDFTEASLALREATQYSVNTLSAGHDAILMKMSGGLDSSIVLQTLANAPHKPTITGVNFYSSGIGDERVFARCMAHSAHCELQEHARNPRLDLRRVCDCNWTVRPVLNFSALDTEMRNAALARQVGASAIFDGELGDNIFGSHMGPGALVECYRNHGLSASFISAIRDYALATQQSVWRALALAYQDGRSIARINDFSASYEVQRVHTESETRSMILASHAAVEHHKDMTDRYIHPWLRDSRHLAPGSHLLLFGMIVVTSALYHSPFARPGDPPCISPLLTQPLAEVALQIPAYLHFKHGEDRAVARYAFRESLPEMILQRGTGKGGPGLWAKGIVEHNAQFIREFLIHGILADRGLIDPRKVEAAVSPRIEKSTAIVGDLIAKLYIEAWLRKWPYGKVHRKERLSE